MEAVFELTWNMAGACFKVRPCSKKKAGERDPEMHQVRKDKQWYFGMKAHVGVDAETKLIPLGCRDGSQRGGQPRTSRTAAWAGDGGVGATRRTRGRPRYSPVEAALDVLRPVRLNGKRPEDAMDR